MIADNRIDFFRCYAIDSMRYMWNVVRFMHNIRQPRGLPPACCQVRDDFLPASLSFSISLCLCQYLASLFLLPCFAFTHRLPRTTCLVPHANFLSDDSDATTTATTTTTGTPENTLKAIKWAIFTINGKIKYRFFLHFVCVWRFAQFRTCFDFFGFVFVSLFCFCFCFVFSPLIRCQPRSSSLHSSWPRAIATCLSLFSLSLSVMESKLVAVVGWP